MTGAERAKAHRARKTAKPVPVFPVVVPWSTMATLQAAWDAADEATREEFLGTVGSGFKPDPMETPVRTKPSQRFTAPVGSLLKGAK